MHTEGPARRTPRERLRSFFIASAACWLVFLVTAIGFHRETLLSVVNQPDKSNLAVLLFFPAVTPSLAAHWYRTRRPMFVDVVLCSLTVAAMTVFLFNNIH